MHTKKELDERIRQSGIQPLKKLGQNFLVNPLICEKIIAETLSGQPQTVVEVGPGLGALTDKLLESNTPLTLIELDSGLVKYWEQKKLGKNQSLQIIHEDALKLDWATLRFSRPAVLVSNLPYSIAASIVIEMSLLDVFDKMILMFQKEVAERIAADKHSPDYGMLSVVAQNFWEIKKLIDAGPQDFHPVPNVGSRVLQFDIKTVGKSQAQRLEFVNFVKLAFSQRRKKMIKNLEKSYPQLKTKSALSNLGLTEDARAQELSPEQFQRFFEGLK